MVAERRRLLLVGGGHAQLSLLERLRSQRLDGWEVTLLSPYPRLIYSGMLPGWIAGHYAVDDFAISLSDLASRAGIAFHESALVDLDLTSSVATCGDGRRIGFDLLSIDTGPEPASASLPGAEAHSLSVRPIEAFIARWPEMVARWQGTSRRFDVVVVGAGPAAVEIAFAVHHRAAHEGAGHVRVSVLGSDASPLASAAPGAQRKAMALFRERGIAWHGGRTAREFLPRAVVCESGATVEFDACIVATGAAAPPWPRAAGLATDAAGFIRVDASLRSISHPQVFAAGDVAALKDPRPKSGVFAVRAGAALADNVVAACLGRTASEWKPQDEALYLISTGDAHAIASWGRWSLQGGWVWRWKEWIDRRFVRRFSGHGDERPR